MHVIRKVLFVVGGKGESRDRSRGVAKEDFQKVFRHGASGGYDQQVTSLRLTFSV